MSHHALFSVNYNNTYQTMRLYLYVVLENSQSLPNSLGTNSYHSQVRSMMIDTQYVQFLDSICYLKVVSATFVLVCFLSLKESTCKTRKNVFNSLQTLFSFSRKSNFRILHFQISWRHQMPKHKTRSTFHWITWEVKTVC